MVGQGDAGELGHGAAAQGQPAVDQPAHAGQLPGLGQVQQVPAVAAVPEDADHPAAGRPVPLQQVRRERGTVQRGTVSVVQPLLGHAGQRREGGADVDEAGVGVDESAPCDPGPTEDQRSPGLDDVQRAVLAHVPALVREPVARGVHDGEVRAAGRVGEQRQDPLGGVGVGVVHRPAWAGRSDLPCIGQEGHRVLAGDRVHAVQDVVDTAGVQPHPAEVVGGVCHGPAIQVLDPDHQVDDVSQRRRGQRLDDGVAAGGDIGGSRGAHGPDSRAWSGAVGALTGPTPEPGRGSHAGAVSGQARLPRGRRRRGRPTRSGSERPPPRGVHRCAAWASPTLVLRARDAGFEGDPQGAPALTPRPSGAQSLLHSCASEVFVHELMHGGSPWQ